MTSLFSIELTFELYEAAMVFRVFIFTFCLEKTVRENNWMGTTSADVMFSLLFFFENAIPNILDHIYV